jgi:GntR family transcriptional regulator
MIMTETQEIRRRMDSLTGPLGVRLVMAMTSAIEDRTLGPGRPLPPERDFASELGVSRSTLRQGLEQLAKDGYVATRPGAGTFIANRIFKPITRLTGFTDDMLSRGLKPSSRILELKVMPVPPDISFRTGLPFGTQVMMLTRLRQVDDDVMGLDRSIFPLQAVGADYDGSGSLYARMDALGGRPRRIMQSLKATEAPADIAGHLGVKPGAAVLAIHRIGYGAAGNVLEDALSWYRGDRYEYIAEITE